MTLSLSKGLAIRLQFYGEVAFLSNISGIDCQNLVYTKLGLTHFPGRVFHLTRVPTRYWEGTPNPVKIGEIWSFCVSPISFTEDARKSDPETPPPLP